MTSFSRTFLCIGAFGALTVAASAEDWPSWGGSDPGRNMYSPAKGVPASFNPGKFKPNSEEIDLSTDEEREVGGESRLANLRQSGGRQWEGARRDK
jgi:hypothetical protein